MSKNAIRMIELTKEIYLGNLDGLGFSKRLNANARHASVMLQLRHPAIITVCQMQATERDRDANGRAMEQATCAA